MVQAVRTHLFTAALLLAGSTPWLHAQVNTAFGSRSFGSGISNNASDGSSNFGQGFNAGGTGLGGSGFGTSGFGGTGNDGGSGSSGIQGAQATAGQVSGDARYLQQNRQGAFVGADRGDTTNTFSQQQGNQNQNLQSQNSFFSQLSQQLQRGTSQLQQQNRTGGQNQQAVRVSLKLGFEAQTGGASSAAVAALQTRFTRLPGLKLVTPVQVTVEGNQVVLRGRVATQNDRELVEGIALLEPGIEAVRNELVVGQEGTTAGQ